MTAPVVTTASDLTPDWLTAALGRPVREVRTEPVGTGQIGSVFRLTLTGDGVPDTLLAKLPAADPAARQLLTGVYRAEVRFYAEIAATVRARVPHCHYAATAADGAEFTLLLEDLAPAKPGDQLAGCAADQARAAVRNLAGLHAPRWCDPTLERIDGLARTTPDEAAVLADLYGPAVDIFIDRLGDHLTPDDTATLRACVGTVEQWIRARRDRFALVHGDYRLDNLLFAPTGEVAAVDWQTLGLGLPARDLAYFLATSLDPEPRRAAERDLVRAYHTRLTDLGVQHYPYESCWQDYVFAQQQGPLVTVFGAAYGTPTPRGDAMFATMTRRSCAAIRDLGSLTAAPGE